MWELDCEEGWAPQNWCFWTVVLEKTLESPLDCKEIQQVHSEGDLPWDFFGRNDAKAETPVLWPLHAKSWLIGKDWCWEGLGAGEEGDDRGWGGWMASLTWWTWVWVNSGSWWWTGRPGGGAIHGVTKSRTRLSDWTELSWTGPHCFCLILPMDLNKGKQKKDSELSYVFLGSMFLILSLLCTVSPLNTGISGLGIWKGSLPWDLILSAIPRNFYQPLCSLGVQDVWELEFVEEMS